MNAQKLYKNGSNVRELSINYNDSNYNTSEGSIVVELDAGDYIEQRITNYNDATFNID